MSDQSLLDNLSGSGVANDHGVNMRGAIPLCFLPSLVIGVPVLEAFSEPDVQGDPRIVTCS